MGAELLAEAIQLIDELKPWTMRNNDTTGNLTDLYSRIEKLKDNLREIEKIPKIVVPANAASGRDSTPESRRRAWRQRQEAYQADCAIITNAIES